MNINPKIMLVKFLAETVFYAKRNYYNGYPTLIDENYDKLEYELSRLCPKHPLLEVVGDPGENYTLPGFVQLRKLMTD